MEAHEAELMADFRSEYGVGLYEVGPREALALLIGLPETSRTRRAMDPSWRDREWIRPENYLALIEYQIRAYIWANAEKSKRGPEPEPIVPASMRPEPRGRIADIEPLPIEELEAKLSAPRVAV